MTKTALEVHKLSAAAHASTDPKLPPILYKYFVFNEHTRHIFENNEVYFHSPDMFNDPFDSKVRIIYEGSDEERRSRLVQAWQSAGLKGGLDDMQARARECVKGGKDVTTVVEASRISEEQTWRWMGIFCMTAKKDNILMWAHYAGRHKGFCLGFRTDDDFFKEIYRVKYPPDGKRPCCNAIRRFEPKEVADATLTKAKDWEYEEEYRIIDHRGGPGVRELPPALLSEVIIGCRMLPEHRAQIRGWCLRRRPRPAMSEAIPKADTFGLEIKGLPI